VLGLLPSLTVAFRCGVIHRARRQQPLEAVSSIPRSRRRRPNHHLVECLRRQPCENPRAWTRYSTTLPCGDNSPSTNNVSATLALPNRTTTCLLAAPSPSQTLSSDAPNGANPWLAAAYRLFLTLLRPPIPPPGALLAPPSTQKMMPSWTPRAEATAQRAARASCL
jgi:hypothetical protein